MKGIAILMVSIFVLITGCSQAPIVPFDQLDVKPQPIEKVTPTYPQEARSQGWEGQAVIEVLLKTNGKVQQSDVIQSSGYEALDDEARDAAQQWTFTPAQKDGETVRTEVTIPFNFSLTE
jgi:TonB family protein